MSDDSEFVAVTSDNAHGKAANDMAKRMWYAVAQPGDEVELVVLIAGIALYIAKTADHLVEEPEAFMDEVHKHAKEIFTQFRERRARGGVQ